ncbi:hypothetical protein [Conchiformibius steedae]|uniref:DUF1090 family protein n=1 Tax=Conchiformibius steedae TaxID=153493 RepID=A0A3P2A545_9NEIS|nr:hypothetical protein [Conchiformibius steedae]RRD90592.1 hypothetical protein EII21_04780 [Conchiformibius steedae]
MLKKYLFALCLGVSLTAQAQAQPSDAERIAALERQVARLTEQVNLLLAERAQFTSRQNTLYVCRLKAFTDTFRSENRHRGQAKLDVLNQCRTKHSEMFCKAEQVSCEAY